MDFLVRRLSPEGQSFRSQGEEVPPDFRTKRDWDKPGGGDDSDDDYENVSWTTGRKLYADGVSAADAPSSQS